METIDKVLILIAILAFVLMGSLIAYVEHRAGGCEALGGVYMHRHCVDIDIIEQGAKQ